jgi:hypothetical protein
MKPRPIYALDEETDPFQHLRTPIAFTVGLFDGSEFVSTWGPSCVAQMHEKVLALEDGIVFIHNGGKFDIYVRDEDGNTILHWLLHGPKMTVIGGRIVKAQIGAVNDHHELRDSMAIMPFSLAKYKKDDIDYRKLERSVREQHKPEILSYLKQDCVSLWELCSDFIKRFGDNLTVGGTAMKEIKKRHEFDTLTSDMDAALRTRFYFGGRVQCFEKGLAYAGKRRRFKVYDINQCYPHAMRNFRHPLGAPVSTDRTIDSTCFFLTVTGYSHGCFPVRTKVGLSYPVGHGTFDVSIHEYRAAIVTNQFALAEIVETIHFDKDGSFDEFVDWAHGERKSCQLVKDERGSLFYKYVGNSGYGKFSQDPENYYDYCLTPDTQDFTEMELFRWEPCIVVEFGGYIIWRRKANTATRFNVATGASITGAARSLIIRGLAAAKRPLYCDTDSIICEDLKGVEIDDVKLGAWKIEKEGTWAALAGKKLYALFDGGECVKRASKGVRIRPDEIVKAASGMTIEFLKDAPTYDFKTGHDRYIKRRVRMT